MKLKRLFVTQLVLCFCILGQTLSAQTSIFTYQGKLTDSMTAASGAYDLKFTLCDSNGIPVEGTVPRVVDDYIITGGIFTVDLDFGAAPFLSGFARLLQIEVRPGASTGAYTLLTPLQEIKSAPWTIKSISASTADTATNATQLGGIAASQYVTTTTGGTNFIRNTTTQQAASNFNISGDGVIGSNLGVGTTNPAGKLHINVPGSGNPISALTLDVGTFGTAGNAVNSYYFKVRDLGLGSPAFLIRGDGNVGIATNDPAEKLDVIGNIKFSGTITGNGSGLTNLNLAGMGFTGRFGGLPFNSPVTRYAIPSGASVVNTQVNDVYAVLPNRPCTAMNLSVRGHESSGLQPQVDIFLIADGVVALTCVMHGVLSCNSGSNSTVINAGAALWFQATTSLGNSATSVIFGWECR